MNVLILFLKITYIFLLHLFIVQIECVIEKIDSRISSGSSGYIWLIKSPNLSSQNINDPIRYSYGLLPGSIISLDLKFEYWDSSNNKSIFISNDSKDLNNNKLFNIDRNFKINYDYNELENDNFKENDINRLKSTLVTSNIPLIKFENLPLSCIVTLNEDEINKLIGNLDIINSNDMFIGIKWGRIKIYYMIRRIIRQIILYWKNLIKYIVPKKIPNSLEKNCFESLIRILSNNDDNKNKLNFLIKDTNNSKILDINKLNSNSINKLFNNTLKSDSGKNIKDLSNKKIKNVFLLLLNSEQLTALNHSPIQNLALLSLSTYSPHFNVNTYIRSVLRIPINNPTLKLEYEIMDLDRYTLLLINGDRIPLYIRGKISIKNPFPLNHLSFERRMDSFIIEFMLTLYVITIIGYLMITIYNHQIFVQNYRGNIYIKFTNLQLIGLILLIIKPICLYIDKLNLMNFTQFGQIKFIYWFIPRVLTRTFDIIFMMYMLLISLGWKVLRDNLLSVEIRLLVGLFIILFYIGVFETILGIFQIARYIFHAIVSLCIIIATNINTTLLQNTISDQSISPRLGILYKKWQAYSNFKWVFGIFIIKPSILFFWRIFTLQPNGFDDWVYTIVDCITDYIILIAVIILFKPFRMPKLFNRLLLKSDIDLNNTNSNVDVPIWPIIM